MRTRPWLAIHPHPVVRAEENSCRSAIITTNLIPVSEHSERAYVRDGPPSSSTRINRRCSKAASELDGSASNLIASGPCLMQFSTNELQHAGISMSSSQGSTYRLKRSFRKRDVRWREIVVDGLSSSRNRLMLSCLRSRRRRMLEEFENHLPCASGIQTDERRDGVQGVEKGSAGRSGWWHTAGGPASGRRFCSFEFQLISGAVPDF